MIGVVLKANDLNVLSGNVSKDFVLPPSTGHHYLVYFLKNFLTIIGRETEHEHRKG